MHILKSALAGAAFSVSATISGAITWTLVSRELDRRHMVDYWAKRRLEDARRTHPHMPSQRTAPESTQLEDGIAPQEAPEVPELPCQSSGVSLT